MRPSQNLLWHLPICRTESREQNKQHRPQRNNQLKAVVLRTPRYRPPPGVNRCEGTGQRGLRAEFNLAQSPARTPPPLPEHQRGGSSPSAAPRPAQHPHRPQQHTGGIASSRQPTFEFYFKLVIFVGQTTQASLHCRQGVIQKL